jgi:hypothetical protein
MKNIDRAVEAGELEVAPYRGDYPRFREADVLQWMAQRQERARSVVEQIAALEMSE